VQDIGYTDAIANDPNLYNNIRRKRELWARTIEANYESTSDYFSV